MTPVLLKIRPFELESELKGPIIKGMVGDGWSIGDVLVLEEPRAEEGDRHRVGLIMMPPSPEARGNGRMTKALLVSVCVLLAANLTANMLTLFL